MKRLYFSPEAEPMGGDISTEVETPVEEPTLKEEDGELLVKIDGGEEEKPDSPDPDPEKGLSGKDSEHGDTIKTPEIPDETTDKRLSDTQAKLHELAEELKKTKEQLEKANLSPEELREQLKAREVKSLLDEERAKLRDLDPDAVTKEEYRAQQRLVDELADEFSTKAQKEAIQDLVRSGENKETRIKMKEKLKEDFDLSDDEFSNISTIAENNYLENGKLTDRSYHHALVATYGLERVMKTESIKAERKAREDIAKASEKQQAGVGLTGKAPKSSFQSIETLMQDETKFRAWLDGLSMEEHAKVDAYLKKKM